MKKYILLIIIVMISQDFEPLTDLKSATLAARKACPQVLGLIHQEGKVSIDFDQSTTQDCKTAAINALKNHPSKPILKEEN